MSNKMMNPSCRRIACSRRAPSSPGRQHRGHGCLPEAVRRSRARFHGFWDARVAKEELLWHKPFTRLLDESRAPFYKWFDDGELNASYDSIDRQLETQTDKTAIIFEPTTARCTRSATASSIAVCA